MENKILISPSILSADFGRLNEDILDIEPLADRLHVDIMDGHFVPNLSFGAPVVRCIKTRLPMYCHLMVENPEQYFDAFAKAGASAIIVHAEAVSDLKACFGKIGELKVGRGPFEGDRVKVGVSINPETPVSVLFDAEGKVYEEISEVLIMGVHPGFGGQEFIPEVLDKVRELRAIAGDGLDIAVDGGVNDKTALAIREAGANVLISGSYIFGAKDRKGAVEMLRG